MSTVHTLHHPNLPGQPITVSVPDGGELSPEYERAGWVAGTPVTADPTPPDDGAGEHTNPLDLD